MTSGSFPKAKQATLKKISKIESKEVIDQGIVIWFPGPESYTGEDMAEFHVHGSIAVVEAIHASVSKIANCTFPFADSPIVSIFKLGAFYIFWLRSFETNCPTHLSPMHLGVGAVRLAVFIRTSI